MMVYLYDGFASIVNIFKKYLIFNAMEEMIWIKWKINEREKQWNIQIKKNIYPK